MGVVSGFSRFSITRNPRKVRFLSTCSLRKQANIKPFFLTFHVVNGSRVNFTDSMSVTIANKDATVSPI
jgi:hypothetical protein